MMDLLCGGRRGQRVCRHVLGHVWREGDTWQIEIREIDQRASTTRPTSSQDARPSKPLTSSLAGALGIDDRS
jgi:hypothetical protein